ncbi:MAG: hypothetical protein JSS49_00870 [Planctomycetes bacterium]|nr:hypothetical protein [Planctomycetota bacterium]
MNEQQPQVGATTRPKFWRRRNWVRGLAALGVVASVATGTWAVEEGKLNLGLRGIFPSAAPAELAADEFAKLNGNWADWSKGTAEAVADFYAKLESADAAGQRTALKSLQAKVDVMQRAIDDPRYRSLLEPLTLMHARLSQRVDFAEAALDTLETDPQKVRANKLSAQARGVTAAIAELQVYLNSIPNGKLWLPYVKADSVLKSLTANAASEASITLVREAKDRIAGRAGLSDATQKEFLGRPAFLNYEASLDQYLTAVAWQPPAPNEPELRAQLKALLDSADSYAVTRATEDAVKARAAFAAISKVAADGGDLLSAVLQKYVFNYNVRIIASEEFLNRLLSDARTENGRVVDNVLGAAVSGNQTTSTKVGVDLLPSSRTARFDLLLNGHIVSNTVGVTSEASVYTQGNHTFVARKEVNFDGLKFVTSPGTISVTPHNTTTGINVNVGGLFSGIAQNIANQEVEARRGAAEAIAAQRVRENVLPKFNAEVDKSFSEAGGKLEADVFSGLKATGLYPDAFVYSTTDSLLKLNSRLMSPTELGAGLPVSPSVADRGAVLLMHETAVNNAIDRMELGGQTLTEPQLREKLEQFFSKALNKPVKLEAPPKPDAADGDDAGPSTIVFAAADPMRVQFENGELILVMRAGFKQEGKDDVPTREITVPITFEVKGNKILVTRGNVVVSAADGEGGGIAINGVVRKKIQSALPDREVDSKVELKGPKNTVVSNVSAIKLTDGWIHISVK